MDENFWKDAYQKSWQQASDKEHWVSQLLWEATGTEVITAGLGAGTTAYMPGSAAANNQEKGGADLYLPAYDSYVEVTGPNVRVNESDALWLRPDKVANSLAKLRVGKGKLHVVVHLAELKVGDGKLVRVIVLNEKFRRSLDRKEISLIHPKIRGNSETYYEIPAHHPVVRPIEKFIEYLQQQRPPHEITV